MQSSVLDRGIPQKAVDGSTSTFYDPNTCTLTEVERAPWWYVNLLEPYMVQLVRVDFGQSCCCKSIANQFQAQTLKKVAHTVLQLKTRRPR